MKRLMSSILAINMMCAGMPVHANEDKCVDGLCVAEGQAVESDSTVSDIAVKEQVVEDDSTWSSIKKFYKKYRELDSRLEEFYKKCRELDSQLMDPIYSKIADGAISVKNAVLNHNYTNDKENIKWCVNNPKDCATYVGGQLLNGSKQLGSKIVDGAISVKNAVINHNYTNDKENIKWCVNNPKDCAMYVGESILDRAVESIRNRVFVAMINKYAKTAKNADQNAKMLTNDTIDAIRAEQDA